MNDDFRDLKARVRRLHEILAHGGSGNVTFAQALSRVERVARRGDRSREPTPELRKLLEHAEGIARSIA